MKVGRPLVPHRLNSVVWGGLADSFLSFSQFSTTMWRNEIVPSLFLHWFSGVCPREGVSHRVVVVCQELSELRFEIGD